MRFCEALTRTNQLHVLDNSILFKHGSQPIDTPGIRSKRIKTANKNGLGINVLLSVIGVISNELVVRTLVEAFVMPGASKVWAVK